MSTKTEKAKKPVNEPKEVQAQFVGKQHGGLNNGVASADPEVLSHKESGDATFTKNPDRRSTKRP